MKIDRYDLGFIGVLIISPFLFPLIVIVDYIEKKQNDRKFFKSNKKIKCWKCGSVLFIQPKDECEEHPITQVECRKCGHYSH